MKTCARCGRSYPGNQTFCTHCGLLLPGWRGLAPMPEINPALGHIDYLLEQLPEWIERRWIAPEQARLLQDQYQERRLEIVAGPPLAETLPAAPPLPPPEQEAPLPFEESVSPPERRASPLAAFFEENNLSFWQLIGALLLLAGLVGLVRWTWGSVGKYLVFALMLGLTGGLYGLARSRFLRNEPLTRSVLTAIAALLVPLDMVAANAFRLLGGALDVPGIGLVTSLLCLPLYLGLARRQSGRWPAVLAAVDLALAVYFLVHGLLHWLLPARQGEAQGIAYGFAFCSLATVCVVAARRAGDERRAVWLGTAHAALLAAVVFAVWLGGFGATGALAATVLLVGTAYGVAAALFEDRAYAFLSIAGVVTGVTLLLHRAGLGDWAGRWYWYVAWVQIAGLICHAIGRVLKQRAPQAEACRDGGLVLAGLAVTASAVRAVLALDDFPFLGLPLAEIGGMLLCAALSLGFFALARHQTVFAGLSAYAFVLLGLLSARAAPAHSLWHDQPHLGLFLALAALALGGRRQMIAALVCATLGLLACAVYAGANIFWETTVVALPLLAGFFAWQVKVTNVRLVWPAMAATVLETLILERRALPWTHAHLGWEPNYGLGLFVLAFMGLALPRAWTRAALTVAGANAVLQLGYAAVPSFPYSPLLLLGLGALGAGLAGLTRQWPRGAEWAAGLTISFYLAYLLGVFTANMGAEGGRETATAWTTAGLALLFGALAARQRRPLLVYGAALFGAVGIAHGLHRALHPDPAFYAIGLWPLAAGLYALGIGLTRRPRIGWQTPLHGSALLISLVVLFTTTALVLFSHGGAAEASLLGALCLYGLLFAVVATLTEDTVYTGLFAAAFSGAFLLRLYEHTPRLGVAPLGFYFSFAGLFWLAGAWAAKHLPPARFAARALFYGAIMVGILSGVIALTGLSGSDARFVVYTLLVTGAVIIGAAWGLEEPAWNHVGVGTYFLAYFLFLADRLGTPSLARSDFYLIPVGLYLLTLGLLARQRVRPERDAGTNIQGYFLAGLLLIFTPTFLAAWQPQAAVGHALLLLTECVVALFYGIAARIKAFVGAGTGFLIALLERETQGMVTHIHWAVYATGLGLAILASALFLEKKREEVRRWAQTAQDKLKAWD